MITANINPLLALFLALLILTPLFPDKVIVRIFLQRKVTENSEYIQNLIFLV